MLWQSICLAESHMHYNCFHSLSYNIEDCKPIWFLTIYCKRSVTLISTHWIRGLVFFHEVCTRRPSFTSLFDTNYEQQIRHAECGRQCRRGTYYNWRRPVTNHFSESSTRTGRTPIRVQLRAVVLATHAWQADVLDELRSEPSQNWHCGICGTILVVLQSYPSTMWFSDRTQWLSFI